ncbi:hypothetical protein BGW38_008766 [Lunasporangiospora selenospora]|uniref:50S ribosomal protein L9, chloroplastic n=1 Tax=Lunasporangiospora selenospora TaxID=979761 RepID=A0A9P6KGF7_9FUNG|nr:hypothetical protein BGW38_008766 [Lunasporangiospora selenospora]
MFSVTRSSLSLGAINRSATHVVKRWRSQKSIEVTLRANVQGLGKPAGRMRNQLYPMRLANYIDKKFQMINEAKLADQNAAENAQERSKIYQQTAKKEQKLLHLHGLRHTLEALPPLVFPRAVNEVVPGSKTIFGSVQAEDVVKELKSKYGITADKITVPGSKIKTIGESWARIELGDLGHVQLKIVVERK